MQSTKDEPSTKIGAILLARRVSEIFHDSAAPSIIQNIIKARMVWLTRRSAILRK